MNIKSSVVLLTVPQNCVWMSTWTWISEKSGISTLKVSSSRQCKSKLKSTLIVPPKTFLKVILKLLPPKALQSDFESDLNILWDKVALCKYTSKRYMEQLMSQQHLSFLWNEFFPCWLKHMIGITGYAGA